MILMVRSRMLNNQSNNFNLHLQVITLVGVFIFCWSPYAVLSVISILGFAQSVPVIFTVIPHQFAKTSILWNAIILVIMNPMVRNKVIKFCSIIVSFIVSTKLLIAVPISSYGLPASLAVFKQAKEPDIWQTRGEQMESFQVRSGAVISFL